MSFVTNHRVNDRPVDNFFEKIPTQGDVDGFSAEAPGRRIITDVPGTSDTSAVQVVAPFSYLVGQDQLEVFWWDSLAKRWHLVLERNTYEAGAMSTDGIPYYEETSTSTITLYNITSLPNSANGGGSFDGGKFLFSVPHTALPGSARNRLVVENQGDNVGIELQGRGDGITFTTPQGKTYLIRPEEDGILTTIPLN
jgi:hypothetical protein